MLFPTWRLRKAPWWENIYSLLMSWGKFTFYAKHDTKEFKFTHQPRGAIYLFGFNLNSFSFKHTKFVIKLANESFDRKELSENICSKRCRGEGKWCLDIYDGRLLRKKKKKRLSVYMHQMLKEMPQVRTQTRLLKCSLVRSCMRARVYLQVCATVLQRFVQKNFQKDWYLSSPQRGKRPTGSPLVVGHSRYLTADLDGFRRRFFAKRASEGKS